MKLFFLVLLLSLLSIAHAQPYGSVAIGDKIPDATFSVLGKPGSNKISGIKKRLVILDFWATWCSSCISYFPKLELLQDRFSKDIKIILVNAASKNDDAGKVKAFYTNWERTHGVPLKLETIAEDKQFKEMFPHREIPHCVWLLDGVLIAVTGADEISAVNIDAVLNKPGFQLVPKIEVNAQRPLYINDMLPLSRLQGFSILTRGESAGLPRGYTWKKYGLDSMVAFKATNVTLLNAYRFIATAIEPDLKGSKRIVLRVKDSTALTYSGVKLSKHEWKLKNLVSFEFTSAATGNTLYNQALNTLNAFSGFTGTVTRQKVTCFVLTKVGNTDLLMAKEEGFRNVLGSPTDPVLVNGDMPMLIKRFNDISPLPFPVIDGTAITGKISIRFVPSDFLSIASLNKALMQYGLMLKEGERELDMLVISD